MVEHSQQKGETAMGDSSYPETTSAPDGATHLRRPEYITAWLFDGVSVMPLWLIEKYHSQPLPEHRKGKWALAVDGEFWRWEDAERFENIFVAIDRSGGVAQARPEPVSYRWRAPGNKHWIYDPTPEWIEDHRHEIELEALCVCALPSTTRATLPGHDETMANLDALTISSTEGK